MNCSYFRNKKYYAFVCLTCFLQSCFHLNTTGMPALDENLLYVFSPGRIDAKAKEVMKDDTNDKITKMIVTSVANSIVSKKINLKLYRDSTFVFEWDGGNSQKGKYLYLSDSLMAEYLVLQFDDNMETRMEILGNHFDSLSMPMQEGVPVIYVRKKLNDYFIQNSYR